MWMYEVIVRWRTRGGWHEKSTHAWCGEARSPGHATDQALSEVERIAEAVYRAEMDQYEVSVKRLDGGTRERFCVCGHCNDPSVSNPTCGRGRPTCSECGCTCGKCRHQPGGNKFRVHTMGCALWVPEMYEGDNYWDARDGFSQGAEWNGKRWEVA